MGLTQKLGTIPLAISTDASNNVGIGGSPSGSYKLEVTGTGRFTSTLLSGQGTFQSTGANIISKNTTTSQSNFIRYDNSVGGARAYLGYETAGTDFYIENGEGKLLLAASSGTAMTISGLNVGIGNSSPSAKLDVTGTFTATTTLASGYAHTLSNQSLAAGASGVFIDAYSASSSSWALAIRTNDGNSYPLRVRCDGNILANASVYNNTTGGSPRNIFMGTDYYFAGLSSIRASKKNIENVSNVDWLYQLNPVTFNYRKKDEDGNYSEEAYEDLSYGLIAEDTQPIADFLINYDDREEGGKKMIGIEYSRLITPMLKAIQELSAQNQDLKSRLDKAGL